MTNKEFAKKLDTMYKQYPLINLSKRKSLNELTYVLRMSGEDYNISTTDAEGNWTCIPSVMETFISSRELSRKVMSIEYDEECSADSGMHCLTVHIV